MRALSRLFGSFFFVLSCLPVLLAQINPPPRDPHELVTHDPRMLTKPNDRSSEESCRASASSTVPSSALRMACTITG
jgi:hypothetical protein